MIRECFTFTSFILADCTDEFWIMLIIPYNDLKHLDDYKRERADRLC